VSNVFDGNRDLDGHALKGISRRCKLGLLTLFEWYKYVEVRRGLWAEGRGGAWGALRAFANDDAYVHARTACRLCAHEGEGRRAREGRRGEPATRWALADPSLHCGPAPCVDPVPSAQRRGDPTHPRPLVCVQVGPSLKNPEIPVWVVCSESHFTVLFAQDTRPLRDALPFDLFFYDELANMQVGLCVRLRARARGHAVGRQSCCAAWHGGSMCTGFVQDVALHSHGLIRASELFQFDGPQHPNHQHHEGPLLVLSIGE
jgi:hypothetical protein